MTVLTVFFFSQGFWLTLVRISEPTFLPTLWDHLKIVFNRYCCNKEQGDDDGSN